jgi:hypothetical protein
MVEELLHLNSTVLCGYDIACSFKSTVAGSPLHNATRHKIAFCLDVFHAYAHNWRCQLQHHPRLFKDAGMVDPEACEIGNSATNRMASTVRHSSPLFRHDRIHRHILQWNRAKRRRFGKPMMHVVSGSLGDVNDRSAALSTVPIHS